MKNLFSLIICALILTSCSILNAEKGSGNVTSENRQVSEFNSLELSSVFDVVLVPSDELKVVVETDDNLQELVVVENSGNTLVVKMKNGTNIAKKTVGKITIYLKEIDRINNSSVGNLENEGVLKSEQLTIENKSVGNMHLNLEVADFVLENCAVGEMNLMGNCKTVKIINKAVGDLNATDLQCDLLDLDNKAVGDASFTVNKETKIKNAGVGSLDIYGKGVVTEITGNSVGKFKKH